jgi:enoyl-CoA hydratase/carnithine racemase
VSDVEGLRHERRGSTAWVTFDRPRARNALTFAMYEGLHALCEAVDADDGVRSLVLRGAGDQAFVAGTDIREFQAFTSGADGLAYEARVERVLERLERVGKPTIALVDGFAVGGGLALAAACDLRVCTPEARFGMPIARTLGNCLSTENYARLAALVGAGRLRELVFTARMVSAEEALAIGLASEVVDAEGIEARVEALCARLAEHAPLTLRTTKEALRRLRSAGLPDIDDLVAETYASEDFREGVEAFVAGRPPAWRGEAGD